MVEITMTMTRPYQHRHLTIRGTAEPIEQELDRLSAEGWEVAHFAVVVTSTDEYEYIYLLRKPA